MPEELLKRLAAVLSAAGLGLVVTLLVGTVVVPAVRRRQFVSRESKEGVARGRTDLVPMGGGFILLVGVTFTLLLFTYVPEPLQQIRKGYAACFIIAFWGFGLLGYLDDRAKVVGGGYSDRVKVVLQVAVTMLFAVSFQLYVSRFVKELAHGEVALSDLGLVRVPFVGDVPLGPCYVPFVMLFLFGVSNAVNVTDGFNGLAGGTGTVAALGFAVVTFLIGAYEHHAMGVRTGISIRMFALSVMSAAVAGSCLAYLYFNFCRGLIYFGDTGSMALGAALAFLALFSRTEFLFCVIGGVYFIEAASVFVQRASVFASKRLVDPLMAARMEPFRPLVIAPLHHHFEHLLMREREAPDLDEKVLRSQVRRAITIGAWLLGGGFAALGVTAQYGLYRASTWLYDWTCVGGLVLGVAVLVGAVGTRFLFDCYFIAPDLDEPSLLTLYRGVPLRWRSRRWFHVYERTDIPISRLGYLEERTGLLRLFHSRVDARTAFGLLHYQCAERAEGAERRDHLRRALSFWEEVPIGRFKDAARHEVLRHMAVCYREEGRYAKAVEALETLYGVTGEPELLAGMDALEAAALSAAEEAYAAWLRTSRPATMLEPQR